MRFGTATPVGYGATGRVLRAFDEQRGCDVALKILHREDPELIDRMLREAALQSRLDHPNICRVFETGQLDGQHYIAMQFIDGVPLDQAVANLNREQRLALMLPVLDAVQAAHREGLIHRDLKPSNLLVEKQADGSLKPYVVDFGLAREVAAKGLTQTGQLLGTPGYLSPEQAEGRTDVDRRSDIFSLGVILYELVCGRPPFVGDSVGALLVQVLKADPPLPDSLMPGLPKALVRILMQCLERDPALRYQSVRELQEDLAAFLDGRTVRARSLGPAFRLRRWTRANRALAAASAGAAVLLLGMAVAWSLDRFEAAERARLSQAYTRIATEVAKDAQLLAMRPRQPLAQDLQRLAERLIPLTDSVGARSATSRLAAAEPLGRAWEALGRHDKALPELERAFASGQRRPELMAALGRVRHRHYQDGLAEAVAISDADLRAAAIARNSEERLQPALDALRDGAGAQGEDGLLARALLTFHSESSDAAYALLLDEHDGLSLRPLELAAALRLQEAESAASEPGDSDPAALSAQAELAHRQLADMARSHPDAWRGLCRLGTLHYRLQGMGLSQEGSDDPLAPCAIALELDPGSSAIRAVAAGAYAARAMRGVITGKDPGDALQQVRELAEGGGAEALAALGETLIAVAQHRRRQGEDSQESLREAIEALSQAIALRPASMPARTLLAQAQQLAAVHAAQDGNESEALFADAIETLRDASRRSQGLGSITVRLGETLVWWGYFRHLRGLDPMTQLDEAIALLDPIAERAPDDIRVLQRQGFALWTRGEHRVWRNEEAEPDLARAETLYREILSRDPARYATRFNLMSIQLLTTRHRLHRDLDSAEVLARAADTRSGFAAGTEVPALDGAWLSLSAAQALLSGQDHRDFARRAREVLTAALAVPEDRAHAAAQLADLSTREHRLALAANRFDPASFQRDLADAEAALAQHPNHSVLAVQRARLLNLGVRAGLADLHMALNESLDRLRQEAPLYLTPYDREFRLAGP